MADTAVRALPAWAQPLLGLSEDDQAKFVKLSHPDFDAMYEAWVVLLDAFEGRGGFLSGDYLWPYQREDANDFNRRRAMARYHNYLESLVDLYVRFLFTQDVGRTSKNAEYDEWTKNVDGANTPMNELMKRAASVALVHGHSGVLIDKTPEEPTGPSKADETAQVIASVFTAITIQDWRHERNQLTAVKLVEKPPANSITEEVPQGDDAKQYLVWAVDSADGSDGWIRCNAKGKIIGGDTPDLGLVPIVILRPKPSYTSPILGRPLISNANVVRALFNRASEEDEVIRAQAFSVLTVAVGADGDVSKAKEDLGTTIGTARALVVRASQIDYKTPDQNVPGAIRQNIAYLVQELYRAAHVRFTRDSLDAESGQSIRLQYTELNEMLQGFAKALAQAEKEIARAWFAWNAPTPEAAQAAFEVAEIEVTYPEEFFVDELMKDLEAWAEAVRLRLGETMTKRIKKKAARRIDPNMPVEVLADVDKEIDAMKDEPEELGPFALDRGDPEQQAMREAARADA